MAYLDDVVVSRGAMRDAYRRDFSEAAKAALEKVEGGPWDGVPVLTEPKLDAVLAEIFDKPVPAPSEKHAELRTPGTVVVAAFCPRCDLPTPILLSVSPELVVDDAGAEIRVKTRAKARSHVCGQLALEEPGEAEGQQSFELTDIVGEADAVRYRLVVASGDPPDDLVEEPADRCGSEATTEAGGLLRCGRAIDHTEERHFDAEVRLYFLSVAEDEAAPVDESTIGDDETIDDAQAEKEDPE